MTSKTALSIFTLATFATLRLHADAPPQHYTVYEGTVRDNSTELTWQQGSDSMRRTWSDAGVYCAQLQLVGGGWRLPTLNELLTIVDPARTTAPVIDSKAFPGTPADTFWSANGFTGDAKYAWTIDFRYGNSAKDHAKSAGAYVRCVR
ncbi:MAG TPA: DUF1566 domain-containing protein [Polyangiales bacterium]|nr:DUF1566 domain-containing protein [Polyangiales bacterium]